jgi:hypothetical protein
MICRLPRIPLTRTPFRERGSDCGITRQCVAATYDFTTTSQTFALTWQGVTYTISLVADYGTMSGLLAAINSGLTGSGLLRMMAA